MNENDNPVATITCFDNANTEVLRIEQDGDVIWKGRKVESDAEFKAAMIDLANMMKGNTHPAQPVQPAVAQEPDLLDLKLPIAVRVGGGIFGKGVSLRTVANKLKLIQDTYDNDLKARMSKQSICRENETESPAGAQEPVKAVLSENVLMIARVFKSGKMTPDSLEGWTSAVEVYESDFYTAPPAAAINEQMLMALRKAEDAMTWELGGEPCGLQTALIEVRSAIAAAEAEKAKGGV